MNTSKRNSLIDITKLFFSICIVFIHTGLADKIPYGYEIKELIFRLGIPFFFVCSGYYFAKNNINTREKLFIYLKKIFIPFIFFGIIYIFWEAYFLNEGSYDYIVSNLSKLFLGSQTNVMWYSGSIIWSFIILYLIKDKRKLLIAMFIFFLLYLLGLSFTTYDFLLESVNPLLLKALINTFIQNRSFWFVGFLFTAIGYYIGKYINYEKLRYHNLINFFILSFSLCIIETMFIKGKTIYFEYDFLISHILVIFWLFLIIIKCSKISFNSKFLRNISTTIYYCHFLVIYGIRFLETKQITFNNILSYQNIKYDFIVLGLTILIAIVVNVIPSKKLKMVVN